MINFRYKEIQFNISKNVIDTIIKYKQGNNQSESGGFLIGSISTDGNRIVANDFTEPLETDKRSIFSFNRSEQHNNILNLKWKESNYTKLYLGEWHTHPQDIPMPSFVDKKSWKNLLKKSNTESEFLIFIIVGMETIETWIGDRKLKSIERMCSYRF